MGRRWSFEVPQSWIGRGQLAGHESGPPVAAFNSWPRLVTPDAVPIGSAATPPVVRGRVSAIVPSYGRKDAVLRCVASLAASEPLPPGGLEIVVVSSGYSQDVLDALGEFSRQGVAVKPVVLAEQELVSRTRNRGAAESSGELLLFVDDDNEVAPDAVEHLRVALSAWPDAAIIAPVMYYRSDPTRIWCAGGRRTRILARTRMRTELPYPKPERLWSVDFPNCFMVRAGEFFGIGGFDEVRFPQAYEEADLAARLVDHRGGVAYCVTAAAVWHAIETTADRRYHLTSVTNAYLHARNRQLYLSRHGTPLQRVTAHWVGRWLFLVAYLLALRTAAKGTRRTLARAYLRGFRDGGRLEESAPGDGPRGRGDGVLGPGTRGLSVVLSTRCPPEGSGGVEGVVREVSAGLESLRPGWEVRVVTAFRATSRVARMPLVGDVVAGGRIFREALRGRWDVFLVNGAEYAWGPLLVGTLRRQPVVVVWHGVRWREAQAYAPAGTANALLHRIFFSLERGIQGLALRAQATVAVSPTVADELRSVYGFAGGVSVIPNGVTSPAPLIGRSSPGRPPAGGGALRVLVVDAQKHPFGKGLDVALDACALAREAGADLVLDVVGFGAPPRELAGHATNAWITWHGRLRPHQMAESYTQADVLLFPTRYEGCSLAGLEALASGLAVVCSPEVAWMVADAGIVVEGWEPSAYAVALSALWRSPLLRAALAEKAVVRASQFTWEAASASYVEVVEAVANERAERWREPHGPSPRSARRKRSAPSAPSAPSAAAQAQPPINSSSG